VQHVRAPAHHHPDDELDLRLTTERDLPFNATLIQSNAERLAMSLGVDILLVLKASSPFSCPASNPRADLPFDNHHPYRSSIVSQAGARRIAIERRLLPVLVFARLSLSAHPFSLTDVAYIVRAVLLYSMVRL
jgi:hypothetical protein